jgi:hypothetical protein
MGKEHGKGSLEDSSAGGMGSVWEETQGILVGMVGEVSGFIRDGNYTGASSVTEQEAVFETVFCTYRYSVIHTH